jgi:AcrR family transcriptional regulator
MAEARSRRGRQAEAARNDQRVLAAAREVFAACGADAPVSAVAERAGVGVGSLYRRYGSKDDLLRHLCLVAMRQSAAAAERALEAPDSWAGLAGYVRESVTQGSGALSPLAGSVETTPETWQECRRSQELLAALTERARADGVLRDDVTALDVAHLIELFGRMGPVSPDSDDGAIRLRLVAIALDGLRATGRDREPLPGDPPTAAHYERRWWPANRLRPTPART